MTSLSEWQANLKRNWKAELWDYDHYLPDDSNSCLYCLTEKQAELLRGIVQPIAWKTRWFTTTDLTIDQNLIEQFRDNLIRRLMMPCGCDETGTLTRITPDGHYQTSSDGGATWADSPQSDPRTNQPQYPPFLPPDTVDNSCTYADSVVEIVKTQFVDVVTSTMNRQQLIDLMISTIAAVGAALIDTVIGTIVIAIFGAIAILIVTITPDVFTAAMTSDVYDRLRCNIKDHIESDGSFTQADVDAIYSQIASDETGIAALFLQSFVAMLGSTLMTNAARSGFGDPSALCASCVGCAPDSVRNDLYYDGAWHTPRGGTIIEVGADYVIVESQDRGDGQSEISLNSIDRTTLCTMNFEWVGTAPGHVLQWFNYTAPTDYATLTRNDLQTSPFTCCGLYFQIDPGTWQGKFTFIPTP